MTYGGLTTYSTHIDQQMNGFTMNLDSLVVGEGCYKDGIN